MSQYPEQPYNEYPQAPSTEYPQPPYYQQAPSSQGYVPQQTMPGYAPGYPPQGYAPQQYPQQGYPAPSFPPQPVKKKPNKALGIGCGALVAIVVLVIIMVAANSSSHSNTGTTGSSNPTTSRNNTESTPGKFKVGDTVNVGKDWQAVVNKLESDGDETGLYGLEDGDTFIAINLTLKNLSSEEKNISSLLNFSLKNADDGTKYQASFFRPTGEGSLDGKIEAGGLLTGWISFEASQEAKHFILSFSPDLFASGQTQWELSLP